MSGKVIIMFGTLAVASVLGHGHGHTHMHAHNHHAHGDLREGDSRKLLQLDEYADFPTTRICHQEQVTDRELETNEVPNESISVLFLFCVLTEA